MNGVTELKLNIVSVKVKAPSKPFGKKFKRKGKKVRQLRTAKRKLKARYSYELGEVMVCHSKEAEDALASMLVEECLRG